MPPLVRAAKPTEATAIHELLIAAFSPFRSQYTEGCFDATVLDEPRILQRMQEGPVWVAELDGRLVGTVGAVDHERGLYVRGMAVDPTCRRQGIGRLLLDQCAANAPRGMWLSTTLFLAGSIALYQSYGFVDATGPPHLHGTPLRSFAWMPKENP